MHNLIVPGGTHVVSLLSGLIKVVPKLSELNTGVPPQHYRCLKNDTKQVPYSGPTNIGIAANNLVATASSCQGFAHL